MGGPTNLPSDRPLVALLVLIALAGCSRPTSSQHQASASERATDVRRDDQASMLGESPPSERNPLVQRVSVDETITAEASILPDTAMPGDRVIFAVRLQVAPGWHIAPMTTRPGLANATQFTLELPKGIEPAGDWQAPEPNRVFDGRGTVPGYEGVATFSHVLIVDDEPPAGRVEINCRLGYQACNEVMCQRPRELTLRAAVDIIKR